MNPTRLAPAALLATLLACSAGGGSTDPGPAAQCGQPSDCSPLPHADVACTGGRCVLASCRTGFADCDADPATGCEQGLLADALHCGSCAACNLPHATAACIAGSCVVESCAPGYVDLDGLPATGCEQFCAASGAEVCNGLDDDCNGQVDDGFDVLSDPRHCGPSCADCTAAATHTVFACADGQCRFEGCEPGWHDLDGDEACEYACTAAASVETACDGADDDCDGAVDEGLAAPPPSEACGTSPLAPSPECTSEVTVTCAGGVWQCSFPAGVGPAAAEICDGLDNDCDGLVNEDFPSYGLPCASDDGLPPPGHGRCRTTGAFVCDGPGATICSAVKADCAGLPGGCAELCNGTDDDCDGSVDETFDAKGLNTTYFVKPAVTRIGSSLWIYSYEASRPTATDLSAGTGNGWSTSAPAGYVLDGTPPCSTPGRLPWLGPDPAEAEQACAAAGGALCTTVQWTTACAATASCTWGYAPRGAACSSPATPSKLCNLAALDFDVASPGDQDGLFPAAGSGVSLCYADWSSLQGNTTETSKVFDLTGNLREITVQGADDYRLMGGSHRTASELGATCSGTAYAATAGERAGDAGFRCCFTQDPTR